MVATHDSIHCCTQNGENDMLDISSITRLKNMFNQGCDWYYFMQKLCAEIAMLESTFGV